MTLHIVSHSHWDREWYFPFQRYRWRFIKVVDRLLDLLSRDERYRSFMMDGQVLILKDYLELRPEKTELVRSFVREGRILVGPWYTQPNEFMVSGEAMIRNLLLGTREAAAMGRAMMVCYLPDAFGHASQLPQIVAGFGIRDVVARRGIPRGSDTVSAWIGADGTECLLFSLPGSYHLAYDLPPGEEDYQESVDGERVQRPGLKTRVRHILDTLVPRSRIPHLLVMNGGDHTAAQSDLPEVMERIGALYPEVRTVHTTLPGYIDAVRSHHHTHGTEIRTHRGELRDPYEELILPGSQSTRADVKIRSRAVENLLERWAEPFAAVAWLLGSRHPTEGLWNAWELLLQNHTHDTMAASCADATYRQGLTRFEWAEEIANEVISDSLAHLCSCGRHPSDAEAAEIPVTVFNAVEGPRTEAVTIQVDVPRSLGVAHLRLADAAGHEVPLRVLRRSVHSAAKPSLRRGFLDSYRADRYSMVFTARDVPGFGYRRYALHGSERPYVGTGGMVGPDGAAENEFLRVWLNTDGSLDVYDKRTARRFPSVCSFEDSGESGHGFAHESPAGDRRILSRGASAELSVEESSSSRAVLRADIEMRLPTALDTARVGRLEQTVPCRITCWYTVMEGVARIDVRTRVENRARDHRLRVLVPTAIDCAASLAEQPFDVVARPVAVDDPNGYPGEKPAPTHPQLSFVAVTDGAVGLAVANRGMMEYEVTDDASRTIAVTLLRCTDVLYELFFAECEDLRIPGAQCLGTYVFEYSVIPFSGGLSQVHREARAFTTPMRAVPHRGTDEETFRDYTFPGARSTLAAEHAFVRVEPEDVLVSAVKKCERSDGLLVRVWNTSDESRRMRMTVDLPGRDVDGAFLVSLAEERVRELPGTSGVLELEVEAKKILSVELRFRDR